MGIDPVTIALISAASTAVSAGGQIYSGIEQKKHLDAQADIQRSAAITERLQHVRALRATLSTQRNILGAKGVAASGSAATLRRITEEYGTLSNNAAYQNRLASARANNRAGRAALISGFIGGTATAIGGGATFAEKTLLK